MSKKMLVDASHPEETRVVVLDERKLEEFDFETSTKKQIKSNIYLAQVVRVEPSLQAAFIEFGGNRHGFLAFNEIHPNYYRIPVEDQKKLLESAPPPTSDLVFEEESLAQQQGRAEEREDAPSAEEESVDEDCDFEEQATRRILRQRTRTYKIQEVIKRRQVMLVQVVKDERGGKGAALTTFISLAGRYCVLMPNTPRGGGISRKISNIKDRKRLRDIIDSLCVPEGMGLIVRTAGMGRTKAEIKRDCDYLLRLWEEVREQTISSTAPKLIYAEGDLISRSIRDLYSKDIESIYVEGEEGYKKAKALMRMLIPSHTKRVQLYKDPRLPLFHRYHVEEKLDNIHGPTVHLPSGGSLVINPTEALVSIDVNSGRATRERHIEETALKTNLEAAEEIARQLRLRDLAGLIVIDFIDMESDKNNALVERRFREATKDDRARIQIGNISPLFGLLEMSRQRLRPSLVEASTTPCTYCRGTGAIRSIESSALRLLRALEKEGVDGHFAELTAYAPMAIALYVLNQKRTTLTSLEARYGIHIFISGDDMLIPPDFRIEHGREKDPEEKLAAARRAAEEELLLPAPEEKLETEKPIEEKEEEEPKAYKRPRRNRRNRQKRQATGEATEINHTEGRDVVFRKGVEEKNISVRKNLTSKESALLENEEPTPPKNQEQEQGQASPKSQEQGSGVEGTSGGRRRHHLRYRGRRGKGGARTPQTTENPESQEAFVASKSPKDPPPLKKPPPISHDQEGGVPLSRGPAKSASGSKASDSKASAASRASRSPSVESGSSKSSESRSSTSEALTSEASASEASGSKTSTSKSSASESPTSEALEPSTSQVPKSPKKGWWQKWLE